MGGGADSVGGDSVGADRVGGDSVILLGQECTTVSVEIGECQGRGWGLSGVRVARMRCYSWASVQI